MSGGRHAHWPPAPHAQGGAGSAGSSPSTNGQATTTPNYGGDAHQANAAYTRPMMNGAPRYGGGGQGSYAAHVTQQGGTNLSPRTMHSTSHLGGPYGGGAPQQPGGLQHVAPSVFGDPRHTGGSNSSTPTNYYSGYEQHHNTIPPSSFSSAGPSYGYNGPTESSQALNHTHSQHPQSASHHAYSGSTSWMNGSPPSSYQPQEPSSHYGHPKAGLYGQPTASHPYKPASDGGYMQQPGMGYGGQVYQQDSQANVKVEVEDDEVDGEDTIEEGEGAGGAGGKKAKGQGQKGTSEFVRKLFRMLDDTSYASIVSWGPLGDSFIVKDMNDFTKHVLPRHFRHSNFASFVRQLNKYDFHKVKKPDDQIQQQHLGVDQLWEFRHPAFLQGREDMLENVKRKVPTGKKGTKKEGEDSPRDNSPTMPSAADAADKGAEEYSKLKDQVATLTASQDQMTNHINNLTKQYQGVIGEMLTFQKNMVQQDQLMQNLIQYLMNLEADRKIESGPAQSSHAVEASSSTPSSSRPQLENSDAFVSSRDAERLVSNFSEVAKESFSNMSEIAYRAARNGETSSHQGSTRNSTTAPTTVMGYAESRSSFTSNQAPLSPKSIASHDTPQESGYADKGKGKPLEQEGNTPSVFFHPPHYDVGQESNLSSGGHKELFNVAASAVNNPSLAGFEGAGLRVFTVGTLQPRSSADASGLEPDGSTPATAAMERAFLRSSGSTEGGENRSYGISVPNLESLPANMPRVDGRATTTQNTPRTGGNVPLPGSGEESRLREGSMTPSEGGQNMLRVRRSTYVPGWAVPPKVLVVDDDDVCRKLGSKFLQVFGCAIDVAVDGVTAVNKMNLEKYDLVLMDIVMPNLDGVSATSLIREFDPRTPIISMTSNSAPNELLSYMSSGMNDVLPKPFTKEGLLNMLEKHLIHLKTVQKMDEIPKALGLPPVSEDMMQSVLSATAASASSLGGSGSSSHAGMANPMAAMMGHGPEAVRSSQEADAGPSASGLHAGDNEEEGIVNPLAGMGFSDEEYISMLQNLIAAGAVSDASKGENADSVANIMGVARGEGTAAAAGSRSKESTPLRRPSNGPQAGKKRSAASNEANQDIPDGKRSRFTELQV